MGALGTGFACGSAGPQLHLRQEWIKGHVTLETEKYNSSHSPMGVLESSFSRDIARTPLALVTEKFQPLISPAALEHKLFQPKGKGWANITELYVCSMHRHILTNLGVRKAPLTLISLPTLQRWDN